MKFFGLLLTLSLLSSSAFAEVKDGHLGVIKIYDAQFVPGLISMFKKGRLVIDNGVKLKKHVTPDAIYLNDNLVKIREYYRSRFARNSYDNKGSDIIASVNVNRFAFPDILGQKKNAAWMSTHFSFGAGKKKSFDDFPRALEVVGHEYTHAVIEATSNLDYVGQSGALNEHFADVMGTIINQHFNQPDNPFLHGATVLRGKKKKSADAVRDMLYPAKSLDPQPGHMDQLKKTPFNVFDESCKPALKNDHCGVHVLSGIPNRAAALIMSQTDWEISAQLFYNVMTKRMKPSSNFADYAKALREECITMGGSLCTQVDEALISVGL